MLIFTFLILIKRANKLLLLVKPLCKTSLAIVEVLIGATLLYVKTDHLNITDNTFWLMYFLGGVGSFEASWLKIDKPLNAPVKSTMTYHKHKATFIEGLSVPVNRTKVLKGVISKIRTRVRGKAWDILLYISS